MPSELLSQKMSCDKTESRDSEYSSKYLSFCHEQLSPCTLASSLPQSRCSSILVPDQYSRISCGSISPISCKDVTEDNDEIKIIITNPHNNSTILSRHDIGTYRRKIKDLTLSPPISPFLGILNLRCIRVLLIFWTVMIPAVAGLVVFIFSGRESVSGLVISSSLFLSSVCILLFILYITKCFTIGVWSCRQHGTVQENNNMAQVLQEENCIITSAENKISWTEFFNGRT